MPNYSVIDVTLRSFEQDLRDDQLLLLVGTLSKIAARKARSRLRLQSQNIETVFVYRLPVMLDWFHYPRALQAFKDGLREESEKCKENLQVLTWTENFHHEHQVVHAPGSLSTEINLNDLRQSEFLDFLKNGDVLFEHAGAAQFFLPSSQFSDYFLRIGNLQTKSAFFTATFYWTLPLLRDVVHFFCDTWSISTTAAVLADYLTIYREPQTREVSRITWSFAPSYIPKSLTSQQLVRDAAFGAQLKGGDVLFLSSFYSSGALEAALLEELIRSDTQNSAKFAAIYGLEIEYDYCDMLLCSVGAYIKELGLGGKGAQFDPTREQLVVGRSSFFPDYRSPEAVKFLRRDIERDGKFFEELIGKGIFSVHRDGKNSYLNNVVGGRHHAFHVDAAKLFCDSFFRRQIKGNFDPSGPYHNVISDGSEAAEALFQALSAESPEQFANAQKFVLQDWRKMSEQPELLDAVNSADSNSLYLGLFSALLSEKRCRPSSNLLICLV